MYVKIFRNITRGGNIITKRSILDVAAGLDPSLITSADINYYEIFLPAVKVYEINMLIDSKGF